MLRMRVKHCTPVMSMSVILKFGCILLSLHILQASGLYMVWASCLSCWDGLVQLLPPGTPYHQQPTDSEDGSRSPSPPVQTLAECLIPPEHSRNRDPSVHSRAALLSEPSGAHPHAALHHPCSICQTPWALQGVKSCGNLFGTMPHGSACRAVSMQEHSQKLPAEEGWDGEGVSAAHGNGLPNGPGHAGPEQSAEEPAAKHRKPKRQPLRDKVSRWEQHLNQAKHP